MKIDDWLESSTSALKDAGITTARLDCLVLLEDETGKDRAWLLSHPECELQGSVLKKLNTKITQRCQHIPLAYIRGKAEFYGREFAVNAHTLVPRPETETMIDLLKQVAINDLRLTIYDIGTGSGAIAITAKLELPEAEVFATDIDEKCLETARANAKNLGADIEFLHGNLLEPISQNGERRKKNGENKKQAEAFSVLLCNLPYVPDNFQINRAATHEPRHALFGGPDGLDMYRELFSQLNALATKPLYILAESLPPQHELLASIAKAAGYKLTKTEDFIQLFQAT